MHAIGKWKQSGLAVKGETPETFTFGRQSLVRTGIACLPQPRTLVAVDAGPNSRAGRPEELNKREKRRHETPIQSAQGLMSILLHWFPDKKFVLLGDDGCQTGRPFFNRTIRRNPCLEVERNLVS